MKKSLRAAGLLVALVFVFGSVIVGVAQNVGGYKVMDVASEDAVAAADFAVGAQSEKQNTTIKLVSIEHAEQQVVAGKNFRLCLKVQPETEDNDVDSTLNAKVVVYRNLQGGYRLTSWEDDGCGGGH